MSSQVATASVEAAKEAMKQLEEPTPCRAVGGCQTLEKPPGFIGSQTFIFPRKKDSMQKNK